MGDYDQPMRAIAADVLLAVENGESLSQCLPPALQRLALNERPVLQALCYGTCRWFHRLDSELVSRLKKPIKKPDRIVHHLMLIALFQLRFSQQATYAILNETVEACRALDKPHLTGLVNAVLRAAEREGAPEPENDASRFSHPVWMVEKLRHNWPDNWQVDQLPWFADGAVSVQDEAAQLCTTLLDLAPGQRVLDACAAPGGKTCAILESQAELAEVVAIDESAARLPRVQENLDRLDLHASLLQADAADTEQWWDGKAFDRILLDVPCSASGVIRRHPDIKLLRRETDVVPLAAIQLGLLEAMWTVLKPGGRLVYATCSVFPQENHRIIQRFLKQQSSAVLIEPDVPWGRDMGAGRQLLPDPISHDGFFYAVLEKPEL